MPTASTLRLKNPEDKMTFLEISTILYQNTWCHSSEENFSIAFVRISELTYNIGF